jgi:hypothetical protein
MITAAVILVNVFLISALFYLWKRRHDTVSRKRDQDLARLEEVIRSAELTNGGFFRSLELVQRNLETLIARAEEAERRLQTIMLQPGNEKKDQFTAAALLLGEGQQPDRVASMLKLPLPQVQTVQALRNITADKKPTKKKREQEGPVAEPQAQKKNAAPREKVAASPSSAPAGFKKTANGVAVATGQRSRLAGVHA